MARNECDLIAYEHLKVKKKSWPPKAVSFTDVHKARFQVNVQGIRCILGEFLFSTLKTGNTRQDVYTKKRESYLPFSFLQVKPQPSGLRRRETNKRAQVR